MALQNSIQRQPLLPLDTASSERMHVLTKDAQGAHRNGGDAHDVAIIAMQNGVNLDGLIVIAEITEHAVLHNEAQQAGDGAQN